MKWSHAAAVVAIVGGIFGACSSDKQAAKGLTEGCLINTDCSSPLVCAFRKCHQECTTSRDCSLGQRCVTSDRPYHVCQLGAELACSLNSDCPPGQTCGVDLQCRDQCAADRDCVKDQVCVGSTCAEPTELVDGGLVAVLPEAGVVSSSGQPCLYSSTCPFPLVCRNEICTTECVAKRDCNAAQECISGRCVSGAGNVIGPEGGVLSGAGGKVKVIVPKGSLASPVFLQVVPLDAWPAGAIGPAFEIVPSGTMFNVPATLTYSFEGTDLGATQPGQLELANAVGSAWIPLPSTVDVAAKTVSAPLAHLSVYGLISPASMVPDASVSKPDASLPPADARPDGDRADTGDAGASGSDGGGGPVCLGGSVTNALADPALVPMFASWGCGTRSISEGTMFLNRDESCPGPQQEVASGELLAGTALCGDFDVQVTFNLLVFSTGPIFDRWASLRIQTNCVGTEFCPGMTVERYNHDVTPSGQPENYKSYGTDPSDNAAVFVPGTDVSGIFRITRTGATLTGYYFTEGGWIRLNQVVGSSDPMSLFLSTGSCGGGQDCTGIETQSVSFSNLAISLGAADAGIP